MLKLHSVSLVLKEPQSDAVELMTITDLYCRLNVKFIHYCYALLVIPWLMEAYILSYNLETLK